MRVLVAAERALTRAGLRGLLGELDEVEVVGQAEGLDAVEPLARELRPDLVLAGWQPGDPSELASVAETLASLGVPLVLVGEEPSPEELQVLLRAGVCGVLLPDVGSEELAAALQAAAQGLVVLGWSVALAELAAKPLVAPNGVATGEELTERERDVLRLMAVGLPNKAIAQRLGISEHTVKFHVGSILTKLGAGSRTEAVALALRRGLLEI